MSGQSEKRKWIHVEEVKEEGEEKNDAEAKIANTPFSLYPFTVMFSPEMELSERLYTSNIAVVIKMKYIIYYDYY